MTFFVLFVGYCCVRVVEQWEAIDEDSSVVEL